MEGFPPFLSLYGWFGLFYLEQYIDMSFQGIIFLSKGWILEISTKAKCPLFHHFDGVELIRSGSVQNGRECHFWRTIMEI